MLNMSLDKVRDNIQIYPENWINIYTTNCYAYALGLDVPEYAICKGAYQPGSFSIDDNPLIYDVYFNYDTLLNNLESDFEKLGLSFREVEPDECLNINEWKIAMFTDSCDEDKIVDFHFLRQKSDGCWFHKNGFSGSISKLDRSGKVIVDPKKCYLLNYKYKKCYALSLKNRILT